MSREINLTIFEIAGNLVAAELSKPDAPAVSPQDLAVRVETLANTLRPVFAEWEKAVSSRN